MVAKNPTKEKTKKSYELGLNEKYFFSYTNEIEITDRLVRKLYYLLHMDIKDIKKKKLRQKLAYLQTELEETKLVYEQCVDKFNMDFSEELMKDSHDDDSEYPTDNPFEKIDSDMDEEMLKDIYKKIAVKVHPDKKHGDEEKFKVLNRANKNKDYGLMMDMADELNIKIRNY